MLHAQGIEIENKKGIKHLLSNGIFSIQLVHSSPATENTRFVG